MSQLPASPSNNAQSSGSTQLVIIAGVVALVAVILMNVYVELRAAANAENTATFFRLKVDRDRNDQLTARDIETVQIPVSQIEAFHAAIREGETVGVPAGGLPRTFTTSVKEGEILRESMFLRNDTNRLGLDLSPGKRLFALPVNTDNQPPNLSPEDRIDIYANVLRRSGSESILVMERVEVRLVGNRVAESGVNTSRNSKYSSITVEVDRSEIQHLADIQNRIAGNEFIIVVRGPSDMQMELEDEATVNPALLDMLGLN